jgi:transcriptional regulator with XRE-family HTH domain
MVQGLGSTAYPESGLDNVVLENVPVWRCAKGHEDVQIPAVGQLNALLSQLIVTQAWPLKGQDVRFLRKHLGFPHVRSASLIGLNHVTLSRFENDRRRLPKREALVRLAVAQALSERGQQAFPRPLIPVLEQLESSGSLDLRDLRVEHVGFGGDRLAEPRHDWQPSIP